MCLCVCIFVFVCISHLVSAIIEPEEVEDCESLGHSDVLLWELMKHLKVDLFDEFRTMGDLCESLVS